MKEALVFIGALIVTVLVTGFILLMLGPVLNKLSDMLFETRFYKWWEDLFD